MKIRSVKIGSVALGPSQPLVLIAGPCVIESEKSTLVHAEKLKKISGAANVPLVFKSSFDKANRTSIASFRGPGVKAGLAILAKVKKKLDLPVLCDVHTVDEVERAAEVLDCLQIPAFLCRQTDLVVAAAKTKKPVNVKKGQFLAPWDVAEIIKKIEENGNHSVLLTERGVSFGYNNLVVDFRGLAVMRALGYPVIFDATHSVQLPSGQGDASGGERQHVAGLARAAVAFGCDGLFLEVHEDPDRAPCDGPNMISLESLEELLAVVVSFDKLVLKNRIR